MSGFDALSRAVSVLFPQAVEDLKTLCKIPSVSFPDYDHRELDRSAQAVASLLTRMGFPEVQVVRNPGKDVGTGGSPAVLAAWGHDALRPTILLYAHHDVQPEMRIERWVSEPFEPTVRAGRLFARGAADDKAGVLVHAAACAALHSTDASALPNIRILIEGEEEVGSVGLEELLRTHCEFLKSDVAIVADLGNFATGVPALTASLRGMVALEIEVRSMERSVHSGIWSGPVPDVVQGLCKMIASLTDERGNIVVPGILAAVIPPDAQTLASYRSLDIRENIFRAELGLKPGVQLRVPESEIALAQWRQPSLTVTTIEAGNRKTAGNVLLDSAWARLSIRLVPGMEWKTVVAQVSAHLRKNCPWGLELSIVSDAGADAWVTPTSHPAFQHMLAALEAGYGTPARIIGCGASIPGAPLFSEALGDIPVLLTGLEDALANAHGENESLDLEDFRKAILAEAEFLRRIVPS